MGGGGDVVSLGSGGDHVDNGDLWVTEGRPVDGEGEYGVPGWGMIINRSGSTCDSSEYLLMP